MSKGELTIYLNDHLAGSVGALELVDHLIETYKGKPLEQFLRGMSLEDHGVLSQSRQTPKRGVESVGGTGGTRTGSNNRNFSNV